MSVIDLKPGKKPEMTDMVAIPVDAFEKMQMIVNTLDPIFKQALTQLHLSGKAYIRVNSDGRFENVTRQEILAEPTEPK